MPTEVLHQIQYLCKNIPKVEWSGALFYTTEGRIEKPETFKITLKTILPLDMGSTAYTEYNLDERFMDFIEEDFEERCTWKLGHIHSHNTMGVFFSGTDMAELNDNAPAHNFYLSLIVNNYMDFLAKVAFIGEANQDIKQVPYTAKNVQGHDYVIETQDFEVKTQKLFIFDCEMDTPIHKIEVDEQFSKQVAKIMEPKPVKTNPFAQQKSFSQPKTFNLPQKSGNWSRSQQENKVSNLFDDWEDEKPLLEDLEDWDIEYETIYNLAKTLFSFTSPSMDEDETLEDVLETTAEFNLTPSELAKIVIENYAKEFNKAFPKANQTEFVEYTGKLIDMLEDTKKYYPEIGMSIRTIEAMITKFVQNDTKRHNTTK